LVSVDAKAHNATFAMQFMLSRAGKGIGDAEQKWRKASSAKKQWIEDLFFVKFCCFVCKRERNRRQVKRPGANLPNRVPTSSETLEEILSHHKLVNFFIPVHQFSAALDL
jgi:hypothetical protein